MSTESSDNKNENIRQYLMSLLSTVSTENPLTYLHTMYDSVNPIMVQKALKQSKDVLKKETSNKQGKMANCFLCLGGDNINEMFIQGIIAALLWLPHYIDDATETYQISRDEVEICKKVLNKVNLPKIFDAYEMKVKDDDESSEEKTVKVSPSNLRHYASFLTAIIKWATSVSTDFKQTGEARSNLEIVRYLAATSMNSFPSIPFSAYFIGSCKTKDGTALAEKLSKSMKFEDYMSSLSLQINQPRFVVALNDSPLVGVASHPLAPLLVGTYSPETDTAEWMGIYSQNSEFERLCTEAGYSTKEVQNYVLGTTIDKHKQILQTPKAKYYGIAKFVENNELLKFGLEKYHSHELHNEKDYEM